MPEVRVQRRLAAVLASDVVGYSRLMEADEAGTLARLKVLRRELFDPLTKKHGGRIFKITGDGAMVEFKSAVDAVDSAVAIQRAIGEHEVAAAPEQRITLRIGISLGDVIPEGADLYGNAVNVAARMEGLAEPGGICVSGNVHEHVRGASNLVFEDVGTQEVKNITEPVRVFRVLSKPVAAPLSQSEQIVQFCRAADGVQIAMASLGTGSPVVFVANWLTHLELDWRLPSRRALIEAITQDHLLIRYDARGNGLSDWDVNDISFEASIGDLSSVVDHYRLEKFALVGQSQGAAIAAAFAARNPDRISHLALYGAYARGRRKRGSDGQIAESDAFITMIREGWGKNTDAYVRMFGSFFMPDAGTEQLAEFTEYQRLATPPENAARIQRALDDIDISDELQKITAPTLIFNLREDARVPFEEGRRMAAGIPNARFVPLEGRNHSMLAGEPALVRYVTELKRFLKS